MKAKKILLFCFFFVFFTGSIFAKKTPVKNLNEYELSNGLTLFTFENHNVPLVYIQLSVRAGAVEQSPENAGLFHLYEHMMFKGNSLYPDAASVNKALSDMGTSTWNGTTSVDSVNYFFTVPSSQLENALAFWNAAIRFPLLDEKELENEKKVVLAEIEGNLARPGQVYGDFLYSHLFPEEPYKNDAGGNPEVVRNATVNDLRRMKNEFYIPSNAAVFVGGDINSDEVLELVKKIYGTWENHGASVKKVSSGPSKNPFSENKFYVMPFDQIQPGLAQIQIMWRGPDAEFDTEDTYLADYLGYLLMKPSGTFMTSLLDDDSIGIVKDSSCLWSGYATRRQSGLFGVGAYVSSPEEKIWERAKTFENTVSELLTKTVPGEKGNFSKDSVKKMIRSIEDERIAMCEMSSSILSNLAFWWTSTDENYFFTYTDQMKKVSQKAVLKFTEKYFAKSNAAVFVLVHPDVYNSYVKEFEESGYELITAEKAHWWKQEKFNPAEKNETKVPVYEEEVYVPVASGVFENKKSA